MCVRVAGNASWWTEGSHGVFLSFMLYYYFFLIKKQIQGSTEGNVAKTHALTTANEPLLAFIISRLFSSAVLSSFCKAGG